MITVVIIRISAFKVNYSKFLALIKDILRLNLSCEITISP